MGFARGRGNFWGMAPGARRMAFLSVLAINHPGHRLNLKIVFR